MSLAARMPLLVGAAVFLLLWQLQGAQRDRLTGPMLAVAFAAEFVAFRWFGVTLTSTDAIVHNLRRRRVPWSAIQGVTQESVLGARRVLLWTSGSERIPLRAPTTFLGLGGKRFDEEFHAIGRWWLEHRGPGWAPDRREEGLQAAVGPASSGNPWAPPSH